MKKLFFLMFSSVLLLGVMGCSSNDEEESTPPANEEPAVETEDSTDESASDDSSTNEESTDDSSTNEESTDDEATDESAADSFNFTDFELEVEYADHQEYEAEYEKENGNVEAEIEDEINDIKIKDDKAFEKLEPMLKDLNINQETPKEDAIKETLNIFDLPDDYTKFKLEITFDDNTEIEFEDEK